MRRTMMGLAVALLAVVALAGCETSNSTAERPDSLDTSDTLHLQMHGQVGASIGVVR